MVDTKARLSHLRFFWVFNFDPSEKMTNFPKLIPVIITRYTTSHYYFPKSSTIFHSYHCYIIYQIYYHFPRVFLKNFPGSHGVLGRRSSAWGGRLSRDPAGGDFPLHPSAANGLEGYPAGRSEGLQRFIFSGEHSKKVWKHTIKMSSGKLHRQKNAVNLCKSQVQNNQNI